VEAVLGLVGMLFLLSFLSPQLRSVFAGLGRLLLVILVLVVLVLIGFAIYRRSKRSNGSKDYGQSENSNATEITLNSSIAVQSPAPPPQTPATLTDQLRKIDWFQFEKLVELVYRKVGYSVTRRGGANPDGGIALRYDVYDPLEQKVLGVLSITHISRALRQGFPNFCMYKVK
jgi:hypothetical protein